MARWGELRTELTVKCYACGEELRGGVPHVCANIEIGVPVQSAVTDKYDGLRRIFDLAYLQASMGKGAERHGQGLPFEDQPMMGIGRMVGVGFCLGQAIKKAQEASRMQPDAAKRELLGAINYLAGAYLLLEEKDPT